MKILFITPYPHNSAPSQRFRFEQYFNFFKNNSIEFDQEPFLDDNIWGVFYKKGNFHKKIFGIIKGIFKRHLIILKFYKYDFLFLHREACFIGPAYFEWLYTKVCKKKIIYDFDDAIWLRDVSEVNNSLAWLKRSKKTNKIIKFSSIVIGGNDYLVDFAKRINQNAFVIPTTIDMNYHKNQKEFNSIDKNVKVRIGWTGSITTNRHFEMLIPTLKKIDAKYQDKIEFYTISNKEIELSGLPILFKKWEKEIEIIDLSLIDIGIMPLPEDAWSKGKCGFKGLQYMALAIPSIMSPVGVNTEIIKDGINGFLASSEDEWIEKLSKLIESKELRDKIGKAGRKTIEEKYSVEANKQKYLDLFNKL